MKIPLEEILTENSTYNRNQLRKRLITEGILTEICTSCNLGPEWNGKRLTLQLEHKNGIPNDNRIENLTLLCPNCHTQTETFAGRKLRKSKPKCAICSKQISRKAKHCKDCFHKSRFGKTRRKIDWPSLEEVEKMLEDSNYLQVGIKLGVSDNAVRKFLKRERKYNK